MATTDGNDEAAEARKKRKAILTQRQEETHGERYNDSGNEGGRAMSVTSVASSSDAASHDDGEPSSKKSKKTQIRYDPSVPMNKEELANWRREHRRVRNRESAAASRQRIRSRITELEGEVQEWKDKYNTAMKRLTTLREGGAVAPAETKAGEGPASKPAQDAST